MPRDSHGIAPADEVRVEEVEELLAEVRAALRQGRQLRSWALANCLSNKVIPAHLRFEFSSQAPTAT